LIRSSGCSTLPPCYESAWPTMKVPPKVELEIAASRLTEAADVIAAMHSGSKAAA
jgi:hypothetical protein